MLDAGLGAIVCVGESLAERDGGRTLEIVDGQLAGGLAAIDAAATAKLVVAYEPVWAIGTGRTATPGAGAGSPRAHPHAASRSLRRAAAETIRIQYGGSVKPSNAEALMAETRHRRRARWRRLSRSR